MSYTQEEFDKIVEWKSLGLSSRKICDKLGWERTRKSTVNQVYNRWLKVLGTNIQPVRHINNSPPKVLAEPLPEKQCKSLHGGPVGNLEVEVLVQKAMSNIRKPKKPKIAIIADTQCKSEESLEYMKWVGKYLLSQKPDIIVHIGDHYDFPSLSSYDKGKSSAEGKRLSKDIEAGNKGFEYLNEYLLSDPYYHPRKVFCLGNHEQRLDRFVDDNPNLIGTLGTDKLPFLKYGWEVYPFLKPVEINGIFFVHYLANPFTGKPYSGNAVNILSKVGRSFVVGHKQCLDIAIRPTIDGKQQIGIVNGACYDHLEGYKGYQGNNHFRGLTILQDVEDGFGSPMFVSLESMKEFYEGVV